MTEYHEEIMQQLSDALPKGADLTLPPPCFTKMDGLFLDYVPEHSMLCSFPAKQDYGNPLGHVQGGFIAAAIDNTFGPFSLLITGKPCASVTMNLAFIRPLKAGAGDMTVEARLLQQTKSLLFLNAKVSNAEGRTVCTASTTMVIHKDLEKALG